MYNQRSEKSALFIRKAMVYRVNVEQTSTNINGKSSLAE